MRLCMRPICWIRFTICGGGLGTQSSNALMICSTHKQHTIPWNRKYFLFFILPRPHSEMQNEINFGWDALPSSERQQKYDTKQPPAELTSSAYELCRIGGVWQCMQFIVLNLQSESYVFRHRELQHSASQSGGWVSEREKESRVTMDEETYATTIFQLQSIYLCHNLKHVYGNDDAAAATATDDVVICNRLL